MYVCFDIANVFLNVRFFKVLIFWVSTNQKVSPYIVIDFLSVFVITFLLLLYIPFNTIFSLQYFNFIYTFFFIRFSLPNNIHCNNESFMLVFNACFSFFFKIIFVFFLFLTTNIICFFRNFYMSRMDHYHNCL